jgi:hypothetical protein
MPVAATLGVSDEIVETIFELARKDDVAAPLAEAFYGCWAADRWSADALDAARRECRETPKQ